MWVTWEWEIEREGKAWVSIDAFVIKSAQRNSKFSDQFNGWKKKEIPDSLIIKNWCKWEDIDIMISEEEI